MKLALIVATLVVAAVAADARGRERPVPATVGFARPAMAVGDRYLVPELPADVVARLPKAEAAGDQYVRERITLAELVVGDRIPTAERQAATYANELPGFAGVLTADGFRRDRDGTWYYDPYASWMRFPLNR